MRGIRDLAFRKVRIGGLQASANGFQTDAIAVDKIGIDGNTDCGTRTAPTENLADTFDLGKFLGEDRVSGVINLRRRNVSGCQRQQDDRSEEHTSELQSPCNL